MYCTNCGQKIEETWKICPYCGHVLGKQKDIEFEKEDIQQNVYQKSSKISNRAFPKKKKRKKILAIVIFFIIAVIILGDSEDSKEKNSEKKENTIYDDNTENKNVEREQKDEENDKGNEFTDVVSEEDTLQNSKVEDLRADLPIYSTDYLVNYLGYYNIKVDKDREKSNMERALKGGTDAVFLKVSGDREKKWC